MVWWSSRINSQVLFLLNHKSYFVPEEEMVQQEMRLKLLTVLWWISGNFLIHLVIKDFRMVWALPLFSWNISDDSNSFYHVYGNIFNDIHTIDFKEQEHCPEAFHIGNSSTSTQEVSHFDSTHDLLNRYFSFILIGLTLSPCYPLVGKTNIIQQKPPIESSKGFGSNDFH